MFEPVRHLGEAITLIRGSELGGDDSSLIMRTPPLPGIYAWYETHKPISPHLTGPQACSLLEKQIAQPHCLQRVTNLGPAYEVTLTSSRTLNKVGDIARALDEDSTFRRTLNEAMSISTILQAPLYIGKSDNLRRRIAEHLSGASGLRDTLDHASGVVLRDCTLMLICVDNEAPIAHETDESADFESGAEQSATDRTPSELLLEEILSKLFLPRFTQRYG